MRSRLFSGGSATPLSPEAADVGLLASHRLASSFVVTASLAAPAAAVPVAASSCGDLDGDVVCQQVVVEAAGLGRSEDVVAGTTSATSTETSWLR
jgi:hypothetical protein